MAILKIPKKGFGRVELFSKMQDYKKDDADWKSSKTWSLVYYAGDDVLNISKEAYNMFFSENGLNPMAFLSLKKFETEVIAMSADMLGGGPEAVGNMTSGGTESILMAVKTARDYGFAKKPDLKEPEMVLPVSAHPAFEKAGHYFGVKSVHIPCREDFRADVSAVRSAINENTVLIVGSAPCYPYGVIDPIEELGELAIEKGVLLHVDACLGGFLLPFLKRLGYKIPNFDLSVPGVSSISADIHKYGYSAKGASVVIYKNSELRKHQFFIYADWPGGVYASSTMAGTKPGGAIASAWAVMNYLGEEGYMRLADETMSVTKELMAGISSIAGLRILGKPDMSVFAFDSDTVNIYMLGDVMEAKGWHIDRQQMPPSLHLIVTPMHKRIIASFLEDLESSNKELCSKKKGEPEGMAALYGLIGTLPDRKSARELVLNFIDDLFKYK